MKQNSSPSTPLVTIVTVVRNAAQDIAHTFASIRPFKCAALEYVVIDGNSTDGTQDIAAQYADVIDTFCSESDRGIYDAMNKATLKAKGTFILNINAGDRLLHVPFEALQEAATQGIDMVCGKVQTEQGLITPAWNSAIRRHNTLPHQGCFYRRTLLETHPYNLQFKVFADFDLNQRLYQEKAKMRLTDEIVAFHSTEGISHHKEHAKELFSVIDHNFGWFTRITAWLHFKYKGLQQRIAHGFSHSRGHL